MKPKYEKPAAVPLGEAIKGSGECSAGSAVMPGGSTYSIGTGAQSCSTGNNVNVSSCSNGFGVIIIK